MDSGTNQGQVRAAFDMLLEELSNSYDALAQDLTPAAQRSDHEAVANISGRLVKVDSLRRKISELRQEWDTIPTPLVDLVASESHAGHETTVVSPQQSINPGSNSPRVVTSRLDPGVKTPNPDYERPILETLVEMGGSGKSRLVLNQVERKMRHRLNAYDYEPTPSKEKVPRWRESAEWCRNAMVRKHGYLRSGSPRGIWEITDLGLAHLRELQQRGN